MALATSRKEAPFTFKPKFLASSIKQTASQSFLNCFNNSSISLDLRSIRSIKRRSFQCVQIMLSIVWICSSQGIHWGRYKNCFLYCFIKIGETILDNSKLGSGIPDCVTTGTSSSQTKCRITAS